MSMVTNFIIAVRYFAGVDEALAEKLNGYFEDKHRYPWTYKPLSPLRALKGHDLDRPFGGNKQLECDLFVGAFNHLDLNDFVSYLNGVQWSDNDEVQLIVCEQEDDGFRIIDIHRPQWYDSPC
jgi:hypothetical protein